MKVLKIGLVLAIILTTTAVYAQDDDTCYDFYDEVLFDLEDFCTDIGRNEICYGHGPINVVASNGAGPINFGQVGDIVAAADIQTLELAPLDVAGNNWGVVMMKLQLNLADTTPDQNVTVILLGDVTLSSSMSADTGAQNPLQVFQLTRGSSPSACDLVPQSGLLIQTPHGVGEVVFSLNGIDVRLGSTVFLSINDNRRLSITPVEGSARVTSNGTTRTAIAGSKIEVPVNADAQASGEPSLPESYADDESVFQLPIDMLERDIDLTEPLSDEELALLDQHQALFNEVEIDDADQIFDYITDTDDPDILDYLESELGYDLEDYDLEGYGDDDDAGDVDDSDGDFDDGDDAGDDFDDGDDAGDDVDDGDGDFDDGDDMGDDFDDSDDAGDDFDNGDDFDDGDDSDDDVNIGGGGGNSG